LLNLIILTNHSCSKRRLIISRKPRLNYAIKADSLRVIDQDGNQIGVITKAEAVQMASDQDLDLVEISPNANPPVAKIVDWGKYNYQRTKQLQKNRRSAKTLEVKQMRFGLKIGDHDLEVKLNKVRKFLENGHKVKLVIFYRGRELAHKELGFVLAKKVIEQLGENAIVEQQPQMSGKQLIFVVRFNQSSKSVNK